MSHYEFIADYAHDNWDAYCHQAARHLHGVGDAFERWLDRYNCYLHCASVDADHYLARQRRIHRRGKDT